MTWNEFNYHSLRVISNSGGGITPEQAEKYRAFFRERGFKQDVTLCRAPGTELNLLPGPENEPAYKVFSLFAGGTEADSFPDPFARLEKLLRGEKKEKEKEKEGFRMPKVPESVMKTVMKHGNRIMALPNGRKWTDHDIED